MSETWAYVSDLAFEAALAGYVVALVCYAIEFAARRGDVPAGRAVEMAAGSPAGAGRGTSTLTRIGAGVSITGVGVIGAVARPEGVPWGERFGRAAVVVTGVGFAANVLSILARGLAAGRAPAREHARRPPPPGRGRPRRRGHSHPRRLRHRHHQQHSRDHNDITNVRCNVRGGISHGDNVRCHVSWNDELHAQRR